MNAFGEALNLVFMRGSGDFSFGSMPMDSISECIPMSSSSYSQANGFKTAFHEFKFLFPCLWTQDSDCIPMSSYSQANGLNLWMHSHEFLFPSQWISGCIPMSSYSPPALWISDCIPMSPIPLPNFWSLLVGYHPCPAIMIQECP